MTRLAPARRCGRRSITARATPTNTCTCAWPIRPRLDATGVRCVDSDAAFSFAGGLVHPDIYLSRGLPEHLAPAQLAAVIEHERRAPWHGQPPQPRHAGRWLNYVFVGPELHRYHHSAEGQNATNLANTLSIFDWALGTFEYRPGVPPRELGLREEDGYPGQHAPLRSALFPLSLAPVEPVPGSRGPAPTSG